MHFLKCICRFDVVISIVWQCPALNTALQAGRSAVDYISSLFSHFVTCITSIGVQFVDDEKLAITTCIVISGRAVRTSLVITSIGVQFVDDEKLAITTTTIQLTVKFFPLIIFFCVDRT